MASYKTLPNGQTLVSTIVGDNVIWVNYDPNPLPIPNASTSLEQLEAENAELKARIADIELALVDIFSGGVS